MPAKVIAIAAVLGLSTTAHAQDKFEQLMRETAPDFTPIYARIRNSGSGS